MGRRSCCSVEPFIWSNSAQVARSLALIRSFSRLPSAGGRLFLQQHQQLQESSSSGSRRPSAAVTVKDGGVKARTMRAGMCDTSSVRQSQRQSERRKSVGRRSAVVITAPNVRIAASRWCHMARYRRAEQTPQRQPRAYPVSKEPPVRKLVT